MSPSEKPAAPATSAELYRAAFTNIAILKDGSWMCLVTGLKVPCGCFCCNTDAQKGTQAVEQAKREI